jgi:hypothetical protein
LVVGANQKRKTKTKTKDRRPETDDYATMRATLRWNGGTGLRWG